MSNKRLMSKQKRMMVGLGETDEQVYQVMDDSLKVGCDIFTIGQYLQPSPQHIEVKAYVTPEKFAEYKIGEAKGVSLYCQQSSGAQFLPG